MKSLPVQDRALRKRTALIDAAIEEFSSAGYEVTTAKSIAHRAGVAIGTFYQYFENKNDILRVIASQRISQLHDAIAALESVNVEHSPARSLAYADVVQVFEQTLKLVYDFHAHNPTLHQVLEQRRAIDPDLRDTMRYGEDAVSDRVLVFVQNMNTSDAAIVADNLFSMAEGLIHRHVFNGEVHETHGVINTGARMLASYFFVPNQN